MNKKNLSIIQVLPALEEGGVERTTVNLANYLASHGHRSIVASQGGRMVTELTNAGSIHITWPHIGEKGPRCLQHFLPFRKLIGTHIDVLHLHSRLPAWIGYLAWKSLPSKKRPVLVTTFHGYYSSVRYSSVMAKGERVIAVSRAISDATQDIYGLANEKIEIITGGYDQALFNPDCVTAERLSALKKQWGLSEMDVPIILLPGRITRLKGHEFFFNSLSLIKHLPWMAICAGDTAQNMNLVRALQEKIENLGLSEKIRFVGHCSDMPAAMMLAQVVVSASVKPESFGLTSVEAQAMGKPVIATAHGGSLETVLDGKTGWLVQPGDITQLAEALALAIKNNEICAKLGKNGQLWVRQEFPIERKHAQTMSLYEKLYADKMKGNIN